MKKKVCVVIPVYREIPTKNEEVSLIQCRKILGEFDLILVCPENLNTNYYKALLPQIKEVHFNSSYFKNVKAYSSLCKKAFFYRSFLQYEYLLIYQTDCFVFRNELLSWCD